MRPANGYVIESDVLWPRTDEFRLRIYVRRGDGLRVLACCEVDALGAALLQLEADERDHGGSLGDLGSVGILDAVARRWVISPWHRPQGCTTLGPTQKEVYA